MQLTPPDRGPGRGEALVPMINVVFLLLVFLLMTAVLAPPDPVPVEPPALSRDPAGTSGAAAAAILHVDAAGEAAFGALRGAAAVEAAVALTRGEAAPGRLRLRVDGGLAGARLAALLADLSARGVMDVGLDVVVTGAGAGAVEGTPGEMPYDTGAEAWP